MNILVPLDGSPASEAVLPWVGCFRGLPGASLHVLYVSPTAAPGSPVSRAGPEGAPEEAKRYVDLVLGRIPGGKDGVRGHAWQGEPTVSILRLTRELGIDLAIMRTHSRQGVGHLLFGSVSEAVLRVVRIPVLMVGPKVPARVEAPVIRNILVPIEGPASAVSAAAQVAPLARAFKATVTVLHVGSEASALEAGRRAMSAAGLEVRAEQVPGTPVAGILAAAERTKADVIAMAANAGSGVMELLMGRVSEGVVRGATCPVLLWRLG